MLVLGRKQSESVRIDSKIEISTIEIKVLSIKRGRVRLGFNAPDHVQIIRDELLDFESDTDGEVEKWLLPKELALDS